jgi:excisionase family DNA binding protein
MHHPATSVSPSKQECLIARASAAVLKDLDATESLVRIVIGDAENTRSVEIPFSAFRILREVLREMAMGNGVTVAPREADLTTQQAADLLGVSRPYLVGLLENGKMAFRKVGRYRRVALADLLQYQHTSALQQERAIEEMVRLTEDLGLYD